MYFNSRKICLVVGILTSIIVSKNYFISKDPYFSNIETINYKFTQEKSRYYIDTQCTSPDELLKDHKYLNLENKITGIAKNCYIERKELKKQDKKYDLNDCTRNSTKCKNNCPKEDRKCNIKCNDQMFLCMGKNLGKEKNVWITKRINCQHTDDFKNFLPYLKTLKQKYSNNISIYIESLSPQITQLSDEYISSLILDYNILLELRNMKQSNEKIIICKSNFNNGNYPWYFGKPFIPPSNLDNKQSDPNKKTLYTVINYGSDYIKSIKVDSNSNVLTFPNDFTLLNHSLIFKNTRIYFEKYSQKNQYGIYNYFIEHLIYYFIALYFLLSFWFYGLLIQPLVFLIKGFYKKTSDIFIFLIKIISIFWEWMRK